MNQSLLKWHKKNDNNIKIEKINLFSENFSMNYVLDQLFNKFDEKKHLLCDINNEILNSQRRKKKLNKYEHNLIHNQTNIILHTKYNYNKLTNINYVKYYLPYCIQPKTNNTDICPLKKCFQKYTKKENILREVNIKKKLTQYRIIEFIKKYTGKIKSDNILHKEVSKLYNKNSRIEIYLKNGKYNKTYFDIAIGNIVFFDCLINILLEDVTYISGGKPQHIPWIFIQ
ncbi:conserved Plasmodium protein, unknown function [Plasmodium berghei]|nr:conserved Plasmodium protein, unknown function [Plasmodium berghei]SCM21306.1 conserved Plasmodium protein, unknown function [Plasmodium berghei]SCN24584.1 conserved Plasmodium protein, unknown function [Plasmodium berghei]SCO59750.1 conserved Plasmodium protein, unknown function [Plasmodium berghei]SCO60989.1 conserved Plasmodium protein, unknown function [Plasmodium berghei]